MKKILAVLAIVHFLPLLALAQIPPALSYQGVLTEPGGEPKNDGSYAFVFRLYTVAEDGQAFWEESQMLDLKDGLFSATLGSIVPIGPQIAFDVPYWLGVQVGTDAELVPRMPLASVAYSFRARHAEQIAEGQVVTRINNLTDDIILQGAGGAAVTVAGNVITITAAGGTGGGVSAVQNTNSTLDIFNPTGPTVTANLRIPLDLSGLTNSPGHILRAVNSGTGHGVVGEVISETSSSYGVHGKTNSTAGRAIVGHASAQTGAPYGVLGRSDAVEGRGVMGFAPATSGRNYGVYGQTFSPEGRGVIGQASATTGDAYGVVGRTSSPQGRGVYGEAVSEINALSYGVYGLTRSPSGYGVFGYASSGSGTSYGIYGLTESPAGRGVMGHAIAATGTPYGVMGRNDANEGRGVYGVSTSTTGRNYGVYGQTSSPDGRGVIGHATASTGAAYGVVGRSNSPNGAGILGQSVNPNGWAGIFQGKVSVNVLHITGGSDLAEPFETIHESVLEPGTVLVIDESHPGKLRVSTRAYDTRVAGVVSGAGGVKPGLLLNQDELFQGSTLVALAGRVYVMAEAIGDQIRPGDLLTTSDLAGHVKKATDRGLSHGAVVGKAMSGLESGTGLVLMLIGLQ